jgi:hypothetical protein
LTVTVKVQSPPLWEVQVTAVLPMGKVEPDGGLQRVPLPPSDPVPQLPDVVGFPYVTTALHWSVLTGATEGQLIVQSEVEPTTVVEVEAELLGSCGSAVVEVALAELDMMVPPAAPESTSKTSVKVAVWLAGSDAMLQLIVPVPLPTVGEVQVKVGPVFCVSDTKVVEPGTGLVRTTSAAASGPVLVTSIL